MKTHGPYCLMMTVSLQKAPELTLSLLKEIVSLLQSRGIACEESVEVSSYRLQKNGMWNFESEISNHTISLPRMKRFSRLLRSASCPAPASTGRKSAKAKSGR